MVASYSRIVSARGCGTSGRMTRAGVALPGPRLRRRIERDHAPSRLPRLSAGPPGRCGRLWRLETDPCRPMRRRHASVYQKQDSLHSRRGATSRYDRVARQITPSHRGSRSVAYVHPLPSPGLAMDKPVSPDHSPAADAPRESSDDSLSRRKFVARAGHLGALTILSPHLLRTGHLFPHAAEAAANTAARLGTR